MIEMRPAKIGDMTSIVELIHKCFLDEIQRGMSLESPAYFQNLIEMEKILVLVEESGKKIIATVILKLQTIEFPAELQIIAVDSSYQRNGIATNLIQAVLDIMIEKDWRKLKVSSRPWNVGMRKLMAKFGFVPEGLLKNEYLGEDLIIYAYFR
ncbi:MAG: GNAT family N-acetyltransferase [Candidatus Heimdallarchaeota archaeon]|nr:GNAT family N-acetyltransferase [Candidatus Heimdallarchaeota archaeon]